jgi:hypothetical protein
MYGIANVSLEGALAMINYSKNESIRTREEGEIQMRRLADEVAQGAIDQRMQEVARAVYDFDEGGGRRDDVRRELRNFATDRQNVHRTETVKQTVDIIERVLTIPVPTKYRWNMETCSKTPGEVIGQCALSVAASRTMMDKYTSDATIYEMGAGIYGRVLDCVWQFIKSSPDKNDLCKIMKTEMEDNIGMCEQGNLTRLANVLAGYMDGVGSTESNAEILGREFPKLWDIDDEDERVEAGNAVLDRLGIKDTDVRNQWIESLY